MKVSFVTILLQILENASEEVLVVASSTLCNLLLDFSPSKEVCFALRFISQFILRILVGLCELTDLY